VDEREYISLEGRSIPELTILEKIAGIPDTGADIKCMSMIVIVSLNEVQGHSLSQNIQISAGVTDVPYLLRRSGILLSLCIGKGIIADNIVPFHMSGIKACKDIVIHIDEQLN
jgi:hypothetical protein